MVRWAAMNARAAQPGEERATFVIDGQRYEGRLGESLIAALARKEAEQPGLLAQMTGSPGTDWRGPEGFARFETILASGEKAIASLAHFTVQEGQRFRRHSERENVALSRERGTRLANWLRRYALSLRRSVEHHEPEEQPAAPSTLERLVTEIAVIGGGAWGRSLAQKLAAAGRKVALVHEGELEGLEAEDLALLPNANTLSVAPDGEIWIEQRIGYERLRGISLKAGIIVFATGRHERPLPLPGLKNRGVMPLGLVTQLFRETGYLPKGKAVVALNNETAFKEALALHEAGLQLSLIIDARQREDQPSIDMAMVAGVRIASASAPLSAAVHEKRLRVRIGNPLEEEDKFARDEDCDVLLLSGGMEPRLSLFLQAGGRLDHGRPVATRTAQGTWLIPVGGLAGAGSFSAREAGEAAADITVLALNRNKAPAEVAHETTWEAEPAPVLMRGDLGYGEGLSAEDLRALGQRAAGHGGLAALEVKLRREFAAAATAPSFLKARNLPLEPLFQGLRCQRGVRFASVASHEAAEAFHWLAQGYGGDVRWKKMAGRLVPHRGNDAREAGFLDVTGLMTIGKTHPELSILAVGEELPEEIATHCSRPKRLPGSGAFRLYTARNAAAAEKVKKGWKQALPLLTLEDAIRLAMGERVEAFFQMLGESVYGMAPRPIAFYGQSGHAGLPQPGERFFASAHAREPIGLVIASSAAFGGVMAVHAIADRLPAELYSPVFKHSYRKLPDQP